jgi:hypothetical protein
MLEDGFPIEPGHILIEENYPAPLVLEDLQGFLSIAGLPDLITSVAEDLREHGARLLIVIDDEDLWHRRLLL